MYLKMPCSFIILCFSALLESQECTPDSIRLTGGDDQYSGKVETCVDGAYTTICDYTQTIEDAVVICRQLFDRGNHILNVTKYKCIPSFCGAL